MRPVLSRPLALLAVAVSLAAILVATLHVGGAYRPHGWSFNLSTGPAALAELIQNLLLFVPLGASLVLAGVRPRWAIAIGFVLSFGVEFAQHWIPGRDQSVGDIICNTASTAIGAGLVHAAPHWLFVSPRRARWQAAALAIVAVGVWLLAGFLMTHPRIRTRLTLEYLLPGRHTIGEGWQLIYWPDAFRRAFPFINAAWLGGWMLLVGFWGGRGRSWWIGAPAILALAFVPSVTHLKPTPVLEWVGAWVGMGFGYWLGTIRYTPPPSPMMYRSPSGSSPNELI